MTGDHAGVSRFGLRLAAARARHGWKQAELAAKAGVGETGLYRIENGQRGCTLTTAIRLANAAGISLDGLLDPCAFCGDSPPVGFTCQSCGTKGDTAVTA